VIPFDFPWWVWLLLCLGFGWIAAVMTDTDWGGGASKFAANTLRLIFVIACILSGIIALVIFIGGY